MALAGALLYSQSWSMLSVIETHSSALSLVVYDVHVPGPPLFSSPLSCAPLFLSPVQRRMLSGSHSHALFVEGTRIESIEDIVCTECIVRTEFVVGTGGIGSKERIELEGKC